MLEYTPQVNSAFHTRSLVSLEFIKSPRFLAIHLRANSQDKQNGFLQSYWFRLIRFWTPWHPACVVYAETIKHLNIVDMLPPLYGMIIKLSYC